ncbi:MAG: adenosine-specific kinase [Candidatus Aenigmatarchaeota archaeon]
MGYIKEVPKVVRIFAATANPLQVIVAETIFGSRFFW